MTSHYAIGVDVGGTKSAAGLTLLPEGRLVARSLQATAPERGGPAVLADVIAQIGALQREASRLGVEPKAVGIGLAELVGPDGAILSEATIRWKSIDVPTEIAAATGLNAVVEADVRAAARAEASLGAGRPFASFLYVTIGTGISSCLVLDKQPYAGARGLTGTFASSPGLFPADDGQLVAGPPLEQFAAGPALVARFNAIRGNLAHSGAEVIAAGESGDAAARAIITSAGRALGGAIAQLVNVLDPEAVVLGGGLGLAGGAYRHSLEEGVRKHVWSEFNRHLPLLDAGLGVDAGMIGAALAARL